MNIDQINKSNAKNYLFKFNAKYQKTIKFETLIEKKDSFN